MQDGKAIITTGKSAEVKKTDQASTGADTKKIALIKRKISVNITISLIFVIVTLAIYFHYIFLQKDNEFKFNDLTKYISELKVATANLETTISEGKRYKEVWKSVSEKKRSFEGINMDEVNDKFRTLAEDYSIANPVINVSIPEKLSDGIYSRKSADVLLSGVNIGFEAIDDIRAMAFIREFIDSLPGYIVVNKFYISKARDYTDADLVDISLGNFNNLAVTVKFSFSWYVLKKRN